MDFSWTTIIIIILLIIIVYFVWTMFSSSSSTTVSSGSSDASQSTPMTVTASNSFTISTWVYINSWDSTSKNKTIVSTPSQTPSTSTFSLTLGKTDNGLYVNIGNQLIPPSNGTSTILVPLQTWASIIATVNNGNLFKQLL
jgi:heme/copper-type cytochrome/quinol oxidase subunit 2